MKCVLLNHIFILSSEVILISIILKNEYIMWNLVTFYKKFQVNDNYQWNENFVQRTVKCLILVERVFLVMSGFGILGDEYPQQKKATFYVPFLNVISDFKVNLCAKWLLRFLGISNEWACTQFHQHFKAAFAYFLLPKKKIQYRNCKKKKLHKTLFVQKSPIKCWQNGHLQSLFTLLLR